MQINEGGDVFVVTGGGSGIGASLTRALVNRHHSVLIIGRREAALKSVASFSTHIEILKADVSSNDGRDKILLRLSQEKIISGLIHNAGIIEPIESMAEMSLDSWRQLMSINLESPFFLTQALLPQLFQAKVLHLGSGAAYFPIKGWSGYCVSKAALSMLTRCWQLERPDLAIASVCPGISDTPMQAAIRDASGMDSDKHEFFQRLNQKKQLVSADTVVERSARRLSLDKDAVHNLVSGIGERLQPMQETLAVLRALQ